VARRQFVTEMLGALAAAEARALGRQLDPEDIPYTRARLWDEPPVRAALDGLWPFLTPQRLVAGLLAEEGALRRAAPSFSAAERSALARPDNPDAWTMADVPLLDEAAQLLGTDDTAEKIRRRAAERERRAEEKYAREVLEITGLAGQGFVDAATLADWNRDLGRPFLGLRARDRGRGAGAVRDGLADGDAPDPDPVAHRGRRCSTAQQRGRRPLLGGDARPVRSRPLAPGAAHGQLPDPRRDHGGGR
jgi:hypothetical protein